MKRATLLVVLAGCAVSEPVRLRPAVHLETDSVFLEAPTASVRLIAMPPVGGRVVHYSLAGENILWENNDRTTGRPRPGGGYNLDVGPEMRKIPRHAQLWRGAYRWEQTGPNRFALTSEPDPVLSLVLRKEISIDAATGALAVSQVLKNVAEMEQSFCLWDRTLCKPGGFAIIPLNPKSRFPAGWAIGVPKNPGWEYNGRDPSHPGIKVLDGYVIAHAVGSKQKIGADTDGGWIAYARGSLLFVKYFPFTSGGRYTDGGLSVAFYWDERFGEMEPISPEVALKPGETYTFPERWVLIRLDREVATHEEARAAVDRIPYLNLSASR